MAESTPRKDSVNTGEGQPAKSSSGISGVSLTAPGGTPGHATAGAPTSELPARYLAGKLDDAERLLFYAAETGIDIDDSLRNAVLRARAASNSSMTEDTAANLLSVLTALAAKVRPVTAESLRVSANPEQSQSVIREYTRVAIVLTAFIIPFSLATFASSAISDAIRRDTDTANALAVKLSDELGPPATSQETTSTRTGTSALPHGISEMDVIRDLQQFAAAIRAIDGRARQLNFFVAYSAADPLARERGHRDEIKQRLELPPGLPNLALAATDKIAVYQDIRYFAQGIQEAVSTWYGAIATCILPVLYALLGACAYLLRSFQEQIKNRTLTVADGHGARFLIAAIGGLVIGLFNNFNMAQGGTLPPLALAFLVGYAVDVFFSFLESLLQAFSRARASAPSSGPTTKS